MIIIEIKCEWCGGKIIRPVKEYKRNKEKKQHIFCSRSCTAFYRNKKMTKEYWMEQYEKRKKTFDIKSQCGNQQDEYSSFRPYLNKGRFSNRRHKMSLSVEYLKSLWEKQDGICPYTGIKMILPKNTRAYSKTRSLMKASLDRIDSSKGYIDGNVEFVCMAINNAKNSFSKEEMIFFISKIKNTTIFCGGA